MKVHQTSAENIRSGQNKAYEPSNISSVSAGGTLSCLKKLSVCSGRKDPSWNWARGRWCVCVSLPHLEISLMGGRGNPWSPSKPEASRAVLWVIRKCLSYSSHFISHMEQVLCSRVKPRCKANGGGCSQLAAYRWLHFSAEKWMEYSSSSHWLQILQSTGNVQVYAHTGGIEASIMPRLLQFSFCTWRSKLWRCHPTPDLAPAEAPVSWSAPEWRVQQSGTGFNQTWVPEFRGRALQCFGGG